MALYEYQKKVKDLVRSGKSVVLQAPTGAGKTRAALAPFIESFFTSSATEFPRQCIYSVPMRVLANQFENEYAEYAASYSRRFREELCVSIQTGERSEDQQFLNDLVFATIDQSLSSALGVPYSLSSRKANMNAGAFFSSYLVFDEFHLFPQGGEDGAQGALVSTLMLLQRIKDLVPFVLMTATFSSTMLGRLAQLLGAEVVTVPIEEYREIASRGADRPRSRIYRIQEAVLTGQSVLAVHQQRSIVICNQVQRAQDLFAELRMLTRGTDTEVVLLHSRFVPEDRKAKEQRIRRDFSREAVEDGRSIILVATQVVEVGLDITCQVLHTEIAPANAVFQRAGRCARYPGEQGQVYVYDVPKREPHPNAKDQEPKPNYLPYATELCQKSWESFLARNGRVLDFTDEQVVIDEVHTDTDSQLLDAMQRQSSMLWRDIYGAAETHDPSFRARLIRQVDNINVVAAESPDRVGNPFAAQSFGLWRGSVKKIWRDIQIFAQAWDPGEFGDGWLMKYPIADDKAGDGEDATQTEQVKWIEITDASLLDGTGIVVVNSAFCAYDEELGFRIVPPGTEMPWISKAGEFGAGNRMAGFTYELESYQEHIERMLKIYASQFRDNYAFIGQRLAQKWGYPADGLDRAVRLAIACHDLAKMDERWQRWVRSYQAAINEPLSDPGQMAVHTHWDPVRFPYHSEAQKRANRIVNRPHHAGESAKAVGKVVVELLGGHEPLARAVLTAIARHHSPHTSEFSQFQLHPGAEKAFREALALANLPSPQQPVLSAMRRDGSLENGQIRPQDFEQLLVYLYVVRVLRLCDGLSQERGR